MLFQGIEICCPHCREELERPAENEIVCRGCQRRYRVTLGIPDLRVFADPYASFEVERAKAEMLVERFNDLDLEGLIDFYYANASKVPAQHAALYKRSLMAGVARARAWLGAWEEASGTDLAMQLEGNALIEVGCGTGQLTRWLADRVRPGRVVAIDFSPRMIEKASAAGGGEFRVADEQVELDAVRLIVDSAAGLLMREGEITKVFVGADRIAANGDVANKIGTYPLSVLAKENKVPFYVVAPTSTIDMQISDGSGIPIEIRDAAELTMVGETQIAPTGVQVYNPAFDVTPAENVTALITEKKVIKPPYDKSLAKLMSGK